MKDWMREASGGGGEGVDTDRAATPRAGEKERARSDLGRGEENKMCKQEIKLRGVKQTIKLKHKHRKPDLDSPSRGMKTAIENFSRGIGEEGHKNLVNHSLDSEGKFEAISELGTIPKGKMKSENSDSININKPTVPKLTEASKYQLKRKTLANQKLSL